MTNARKLTNLTIAELAEQLAKNYKTLGAGSFNVTDYVSIQMQNSIILDILDERQAEIERLYKENSYTTLFAFEISDQYYGDKIERFLCLKNSPDEAIDEAIIQSEFFISQQPALISAFAQDLEEDGIEEGSEVYEGCIQGMICDNVEYSVYKVVDRYDTFEKMEEDFIQKPNEFIEKHCKQV